jgi:hypothetical protein
MVMSASAAHGGQQRCRGGQGWRLDELHGLVSRVLVMGTPEGAEEGIKAQRLDVVRNGNGA